MHDVEKKGFTTFFTYHLMQYPLSRDFQSRSGRHQAIRYSNLRKSITIVSFTSLLFFLERERVYQPKITSPSARQIRLYTPAKFTKEERVSRKLRFAPALVKSLSSPRALSAASGETVD